MATTAEEALQLRLEQYTTEIAAATERQDWAAVDRALQGYIRASAENRNIDAIANMFSRAGDQAVERFNTGLMRARDVAMGLMNAPAEAMRGVVSFISTLDQWGNVLNQITGGRFGWDIPDNIATGIINAGVNMVASIARDPRIMALTRANAGEISNLTEVVDGAPQRAQGAFASYADTAAGRVDLGGIDLGEFAVAARANTALTAVIESVLAEATAADVDGDGALAEGGELTTFMTASRIVGLNETQRNAIGTIMRQEGPPPPAPH